MVKPVLSKERISVILKFLLGTFLVLKVHRAFYVDKTVQGGLWNFIQILFVIIGLYFLFTPLKKRIQESSIFYFALFSLYIWFASFFIFMLYGDFSAAEIYRFMMKPYGFFVFFSFLYCASYTKLEDNRYAMIVLFVGLASMIIYAMIVYRWRLTYDDKGAIADVYYVLGLLPFILAVSAKKLRIVLYAIAFFAIMMTGKRAGFICVSFLFVLNFIVSPKKEIKITKILFACLVLFIFLYLQDMIVSYFNVDMFARLEKLDHDGGSGRTARWNMLVNALVNNTTPIQLLFGHGSGATIAFTGFAHNDFLQIFYDYGLVAFVLYVLFYVSLIKDAIIMKIKEYPYFREFASVVVVMLFLAMFSFFAIDCMYITCTSFCLAYFYADWFKFQREIYK